MLRVGFEPTITAFELAKTVHVLNRAATGIGMTGNSERTVKIKFRENQNRGEVRYEVLTAVTVKSVVLWLEL
jgi:hypothetical protein